MQDKHKIGIIGYGVVGKAYAKIFNQHLIHTYDPILNIGDMKTINDCYLSIICVPTPSNKDGSADIEAIRETVCWCESPIILIKSTVPPGTTEYLSKKYNKHIVFSPEYLGESSYYTPYDWKPIEEPFMIVGGEPEDRREVLKIFQPILGPFKRYIQMTSTEAEIVKYMENSYFAMTVGFFNEFYEICKVFKADYNIVREGWMADPRVMPTHSLVFEDRRGFDGKCLPKDLSAIITASNKAGFEPPILRAALRWCKKKTIT